MLFGSISDFGLQKKLYACRPKSVLLQIETDANSALAPQSVRTLGSVRVGSDLRLVYL